MYYEARYRRAQDGQYRWFMVRVVPQRDKRGKIVKWYGTASDMEDRKRAEELQSQPAHINRVSTMGELSSSLSHELKKADCGRGDKRSAPRGYSTVITTFALACPSST
jgi:PAS fold